MKVFKSTKFLAIYYLFSDFFSCIILIYFIFQTNYANMSFKIYNKICEFLMTAKEYQINATSVIYLGMKKTHWISQIELKKIVEQAVGFAASNVFTVNTLLAA
jgi:hypothetical protein